ncbi:asparaginyl/glutamyl-tRNA amidotransferase subunit C [Candidatus Parcubacteria bacterium A4]|nr:MAG: asparaginyl/glutamyl-tRNA amidotransferase subunit C [Candidatus Parcubacteria bacterium A4]
MIKEEEVQHIAKLARIGLSDEKAEKVSKEFSEILNFVEKLKEADVGGIETISHSIKVCNVIREDLPREIENIKDGNREKLMEEAREREGGYVKVKSIFPATGWSAFGG